MKRRPVSGRVAVETVRQRGGDSLESVRQRVLVVRENELMETGEEVRQYQVKEQQERQKMDELRTVAEIRGEEAHRRLEQKKWLEEKMTREEMERKESVRLIEMLRTARIINEAPVKPSVSSHQSDTDSQRPSTTRTIQSGSETETMTDSNVKISRVKPTVTFADSSKGSQAKPTRQQESFPEHKERQFVKLGSGIKPLDETEDVSSISALSTIMEESERVSSQSLSNIQKSDNELTMTTFPFSSITTDRNGKKATIAPPPQNINLSEVRKIIDRVKRQGERLPLTETHFQTIAGNGNGSIPKMDSGGGKEKEKYSVNHQFIKKVLDFSSLPSSSLSSDESSTFLPLQKAEARGKIGRAKANPVTKSKLPNSKPTKKPNVSPILKPQFLQTSDDSSGRISPQSISSFQDYTHKENSNAQAELRRYIIKLLQMKQEDIENLSVSTTLTSSSTTDPDLKMDYDTILELYQSTRSNLQSKLSKSS